jgi:competence ComEA-like helix-hairpin-helix protein
MNSTSSFNVFKLTGAELAVWTVILCAAIGFALREHVARDGALEVRVRIASVEARSATELPMSGTWRMNLNSASAAELTLLPGIGQRRAQLIVQERGKRGAFTSVWQLCEVPSLSKPLVQRIAPLLKVSPAVSPAP